VALYAFGQYNVDALHKTKWHNIRWLITRSLSAMDVSVILSSYGLTLRICQKDLDSTNALAVVAWESRI
jgi:hypothetical protein